jgi:hypothetical protein
VDCCESEVSEGLCGDGQPATINTKTQQQEGTKIKMKMNWAKSEREQLESIKHGIEQSLSALLPIRGRLTKLAKQAEELPALIEQRERAADPLKGGAAFDEIAGLTSRLRATERALAETQEAERVALEDLERAARVDLWSFAGERVNDLEAAIKKHLTKVCEENVAHGMVRQTTAFQLAVYFLRWDSVGIVDKEAAAKEAVRCIDVLLSDDVPGFNMI